ncbi:hypothetical protein GPL15_10435 [Clostridium sp. MCC353]|uniref:sensor histidine kinase n=1 Tax=Clostridium sp. MCC353 TaxID=2592646 RepID=UPI001C00F8DF|nr:histidine kinase [Clostridium sp. MCC353]MBT9776922.1 hypothetical protein [Clostridium sp. MCC353]
MKKNSLLSKLIISNLVFFLLPAVVCLILASVFFSNRLLTDRRTTTQYILNDVSTSVSGLLTGISNISVSIIADDTIRDFILADHPAPTSQYLELYSQALSTLQTMISQNTAIRNIYIQTIDGRQLCTGAYSKNAPIFTEQELTDMNSTYGQWALFSEGEQLSFCRSIRDMYHPDDKIAYLKIMINRSALNRFFTSSQMPDDIFFALWSQDGRMLTHNLTGQNRWLTDQPDLNTLFRLKQGERLPLHGEDGYYYALSSRLFHGRLYLTEFAVDKKIFYRRMILVIILALTCIFVIFAAVQIIFYRHFLVRPVLHLGKLMESIELEDYSVQFDYKVSRELEQLVSRFNTMSKRLHFLYSQVYQTNLQYKEAEIKNLQAEINPHFLYNVLDSICWLIELGRTENASRMVRMLSSLFRLSLIRTDDGLIPLSKELEHVNLYVNLQQERFENHFQFTLDVEETIDCSSVYVMKLLLQPLVENAIVHGIVPDRNDGEIIVTVYRENEDLIYHIYDNGIGIDPDSIRRLLAHSNPPADTHGLALNNINERLKLKYGDAYGLSYFRPGMGGSIFIVRQPVITKEEPIC